MSLHSQLQLDLHGRLEADAYFADIDVSLVRPRARDGWAQIAERTAAILGGIKKKAGKAGASVQVLMPAADQLDPNVSGPRLAINLTVRVQELVEINLGPVGTGKTAEDIAERVAQLGHHFSSIGGNTLVFLDMIPTDEEAPRVSVDVTFRVQTGLVPLPKVARPVFTPATGAAPQSVTLVCATAGAAIYYTTDGSYPSPRSTCPSMPTATSTSAPRAKPPPRASPPSAPSTTSPCSTPTAAPASSAS